MTAVATIPLTYNGYVTQIANMAVMSTQEVSGIVSGVDATFNTMLSQALNYAELRIQRDLDLLPSLTSNSYTLSTGNNQLQISVNDFVTIQTLSVNGFPLLPVSKEYLQNVYSTNAVLAQPVFFAMVGGDSATGGNTYNNILVGPYPDQNYPVSVYGTIRLPSLINMAVAGTADTGTTFISTYLADLLIMASMIYVSGFQRNFSSSANDPQMPVNYESQYQTLLKGALTEEARKRFASVEWTSYSPSPTAALPR